MYLVLAVLKSPNKWKKRNSWKNIFITSKNLSSNCSRLQHIPKYFYRRFKTNTTLNLKPRFSDIVTLEWLLAERITYLPTYYRGYKAKNKYKESSNSNLSKLIALDFQTPAPKRVKFGIDIAQFFTTFDE